MAQSQLIMPNSETGPQSVIRSWLKSWGFIDNPFALWEAGREPWLNRYFIKRPFYDELLNSQKSTLIFAPRGGGKSATRIMLENECRPTTPTAAILAVPFTDFSPIAETATHAAPITLAVYVPHLVDAILTQFLATLATTRNAAAHLSAKDAGALRFYIDRYGAHVLSPVQLRALLRRAKPGLNDREAATLADRVHRPETLPDYSDSHLNAFAHCLSLLLTQPAISPSRPIDSPSRVMESLVTLLLQLLNYEPTPCRVIYLLIDGVDEYALTQDNPDASAEFLRPLLGNLHFLELPGLVTKFFLPLEQRAALERVARTDRLDIVPLVWEPPKAEDGSDDLLQLLRRRIATFNTRGLIGLGELCDPSLRRSLEDDMLEVAHGSPRNLLRLGNLVFTEHCRDIPAPESVLLPDEWERAVDHFRSTVQGRIVTSPVDAVPLPITSSTTVPPRLHVDTRTGKVYRGAEELPALSDLEYRLLEFLYRRRGQFCSKDEIALAVYEPKYSHGKSRSSAGISDASLFQLIDRLRQRVEPHPSQPIYITSKKGRGYRLDNAD
jgi:DNA-binding winged helix-turn-helix (wHTH) protein